MGSEDHRKALVEIQKVLDRYCLVGIYINPESRESPTEVVMPKDMRRRMQGAEEAVGYRS